MNMEVPLSFQNVRSSVCLTVSSAKKQMEEEKDLRVSGSGFISCLAVPAILWLKGPVHILKTGILTCG